MPDALEKLAAQFESYASLWQDASDSQPRWRRIARAYTRGNATAYHVAAGFVRVAALTRAKAEGRDA